MADYIDDREIWVNEFTEKSAQKFRDQVLAWADEDKNRVIPIYIDSYGGYVDSLAKMLETMDEVPNRFITICNGKAISCGAILLSYGDVRYCGRLSRIMIHNVSAGSWGDTYEIKARSDETMRMNEVFMGILADRCGITYKELQAKIRASTCGKEIWMDADASKKFGLVDYVGLPRLIPHVHWEVQNLPKKEPMPQPEELPLKKKKKKKATKKTKKR